MSLLPEFEKNLNNEENTKTKRKQQQQQQKHPKQVVFVLSLKFYD